MTDRGTRARTPSAELFESVVEQLPYPVVILDPHGEPEYINAAFPRLLGYEPEDVATTEDWYRLAYPDPVGRREILESWKTDSAAANGRTFGPRTLRVTCKDGSQRDLTMIVQPYPDGRQVVVIIDDTERIRTLEALRAEESRYRAVSDLVSDYAYSFRVTETNHLEVEWVTGALPKISGFTLEELRALGSWKTLLYPDDLPRAEAQLEQLLGGHASTIEYRITTKDGSLRWMRDFARPEQDDGRTVRILGAVQDVDERKRAEDERTRLLAQMLHVQKLESLGVLAGGIAHDFNNILVAVTSYADLALRQTPASANTRRYLAQIKEASVRLAELTDQMLAYSGRASLAVTPLDLDELVSKIGQLLAVSVSKNARLRYQLSDDLPPVDGDPTQLRQVVMNLILNASDAVADRGGTITVTTECVHADRQRLAATFVDDDLPAGRYVVLSVADDGPGIPEQVQPRIFEPFFTTKFSGRGLGLAAVLGIVRSHRGAIEVTSRANEGTTIRVLLPPSPAPRASLAVDPPPETTPPASWTVLVVDDEESVGLVVAEILEANGHRAVVTRSGREALAALREDGESFDAVVLDLTMPGMSGYDCLRELRSLRPELPVVLTSGYTEVDARNALQGQPLAAFLKKPFEAETLLASLRAALA